VDKSTSTSIKYPSMPNVAQEITFANMQRVYLQKRKCQYLYYFFRIRRKNSYSIQVISRLDEFCIMDIIITLKASLIANRIKRRKS
jgi:hypothetical protein